MKKVIVGVLIVVIFGILGAPFANGLIMENVVKQSMRDFAEKNHFAGSDVSFEIIDYQRKFSSSRIEWKIALGNLKSFYGVEEIRVVDQAQHGYTGVVSKSTLMHNKWYADLVNNKLDGNDPLDITTHYKLFGQIESAVTLNSFSFEDEEDTIAVKPAKVLVACDKGFKTIASQGSCGGITVQDKFRMDEFSFSSNLEMISDYIWDGDGSITVKNSKSETGQEPFEISNLKADYSMDFDKEKNTVSIGIGYGADTLRFKKNNIDNASVRIGIYQMNAQGYEALMALYTKTLNETMSSMAAAPDDPEKIEALMQQKLAANGIQLIAAFEKVLKDGLEIQVTDLSAKLPRGEIKGDVALSLTKDMTMANLFPIISEPKLALDVFSLQSDLSLPAALVGDNPKWLSPIYPGMQTGLFEIEGAKMVHKAETKEGKLFLNGQEVLFN